MKFNIFVALVMVAFIAFLVYCNIGDDCKEYAYVDEFNKHSVCKIEKTK